MRNLDPESVGVEFHERRRRLGTSLTLLVTAALTLGLGLPGAGAESLNDQKSRVEQQIQVSGKQVTTSRAKVSTATSALADSQQKLADAQAALADTQSRLAQARTTDAFLSQSLAEEQRKLEKAEEATAAARVAVEKQRRLIADVARQSYQQQTDLVGMSVLLGATSATDLTHRIQWNRTIFTTTAADLELLQELEESLAAAEKAQAAIEAELSERKAAAEDNVRVCAELEVQAASQTRAISALVTQNEQAKAAAVADFNAVAAENESLKKDLARIKAEIQAEIEAERAAEAARKAAELAAKKAAEKAARSSGKNGTTGSTRVTSSAGFTMPVNGARISSSFGYRVHPVTGDYSFHSGVDFAVGCGTPIYATRAGTVKTADYEGNYGHYIRINHGLINGVSFQSGYAHLSKYAVSPGDQVKAGQLIGYVGTTGRSTGCHLHFEIYKNGSVVNPMNYL